MRLNLEVAGILALGFALFLGITLVAPSRTGAVGSATVFGLHVLFGVAAGLFVVLIAVIAAIVFLEINVPRMIATLGAAACAYFAIVDIALAASGRDGGWIGGVLAHGVRVLVDGVGEWYSWPHAVTLLHRAGVRAARFLAPRLLPFPRLAVNMRNHRKLLLVDGQVAFLGGMNIGGREVGRADHRRMADLHFQLRGPIVAQLARAFSIDWQFAAAEELTALPPCGSAGTAACRAITDGPDEDNDKLLYVIVGALSVARHQILMMTPYFIPQPELTSALQAAALRGVEVSLVLPERSNLRYVDWASRRWLPPLLERGVRIFLQPAPFSHTKLLIVDGAYAQIGSANMDLRSLRLNFEIAVEIYCADTCRQLVAYVEAARGKSAPYTLEFAGRLSLPARTRNSLFWLLSPYL